MRRSNTALSSAAASFLACAAAAVLAAPAPATGVPAIREFFSGAEARAVGSPGNRQAEEKIADLFSASGLEHGEIRFRAPRFLPGRTRMRLADGPPVRLRPMHPTTFRPGNFTSQAFSTTLVYLGRGTQADLARISGTPLDGAIALMDFNCGDNWQRLLRFGVRGFVFIGETNYEPSESEQKIYATEVAVPRFLVTAEEGATLKRALAGGAQSIAVEAEPSRWENTMLRDLWVLVPGADETLAKEVVVFTAPLDSNCVVPGLGEGAQSAANLYLLVQLFTEFRERPPARSVLFVAVNGHTQKFAGERLLAWHLLTPSAPIEAVRNVIADDIRTQELLAATYEKLKLDGSQSAADEAFLIELRSLTDRSTGKQVTLKEAVMALSRRDVNQVKARQLKLARDERPEAQIAADRERLEAERAKYVHVMTLFNKVGVRTRLGELTAEELEILRGYVRETVARNRRWAELNRADLEVSKANDAVRKTLAGRKVPFVVSLDLDWQNAKIGFSSGDYWGNETWYYRFGKNVVRLAAPAALAEPAEPAEPAGAGGSASNGASLLVDTLTNVGGMSPGYFFAAPSPVVRTFHAAGFTPAFSFANVFTAGGRSFSPDDTFDNLDADHVAATLAYVPGLFRRILDDSLVTVSSELPRPKAEDAWGLRIRTFKFDEFSAAVTPSLPVPGSAVILRDGSAATATPIVAGDVVNSWMQLTDERAVADFYGLGVGLERGSTYTAAFRYDADFVRVDHAVDSGDAQKRLSSNLTRAEALYLTLFECRESVIAERHDPSLIGAAAIRVDDIHILDARHNSSPRKYGTTGIRAPVSTRSTLAQPGPAAIYVEPDDPFKLVTSGKRLALNAVDEDSQELGYGGDREPLSRDLFAVAARDMGRLNRRRAASMGGVSDQLAEAFMAVGDSRLADAEAAAAKNDHLGFVGAVYDALGSQVKAYQQTARATNDMLKAVVFYMALLLPFCFFMQKLLFNTVRIERQLGLFVVLFVLTYVGFRFIHPAFSIAQAPEAMFVAFVMGALGLFVIKILHGRFEGEMQLMFRAHTEAELAEVGYSSVSQQAMLIGVNNMKRRRVRTTLTAGTVVLVTFTMLAFTSVSRQLSPTVIRRASAAPYTGLMYHWPGKAMDEASLRVFQDLFVGDESHDGETSTVVRRWLSAPRIETSWKKGEFPIRVGRADSDAVANIDALLGLSVVEDGFLGAMPLIPGGRFFSSDDAAEAVLPASVADVLGITPANLSSARIEFRGRELDVVGLLHDEKFRALRDINDRPLLPVKTMLKKDEGDDDVSVDTEDAAGVIYVETSALVVVPLETCRRLGGAPFSISVRLPDNAPVWPVMKRLLTIGEVKFNMASRVAFRAGDGAGRQTDPGVYYVGSGYRTSIGGLAQLIIPILIASTLVMNTMLGSVFERKREIAIYNAVGLNPTHIGLFFLAEAFVYGIVGSVGGYLIGQVLSLGLNRLGWVSDINLNFSSLSVVYVIMFTIGVVLLSTLYPAIIATRAAVPSGKRKWSMPAHHDNEMHVPFPFIYQSDLLPGVIAYLQSYFDRYAEASVGDMIAEPLRAEQGRDGSGRDVYDLEYRVALAPYDLGVTQKVALRAGYDDEVEAHRVVMTITRLSGQDSNWTTTNQPFLERLRQHLMHWRNLEPGERALYVEQGSQVFDEARVG